MKALYHDGKFVRLEKGPASAVKPKSIAWVDVVETPPPTIAADERLERVVSLVGGKHLVTWRVEKKSKAELAREKKLEQKNRDIESERITAMAALDMFKSGTATLKQTQRAVALLLEIMEK